jgi:hypothetical protein
MPNQFVIFCEVRTGSYALVSRLDSASDIVCHGEIFHFNKLGVRDDYLPALAFHTVAERNANQMAYIEQLRAMDPGKHFGFKVLSNQLAYARKVVPFVEDPLNKRVILYRDPIASYGSLLRSQATGIWMVEDSARVPQAKLQQKVRFTVESFNDFVARYNNFIKRANELAAMDNSFVLSYEQIEDPDVINSLFKFLGSEADAESTSMSTAKQFIGDLEEGFENWGELQDFLKTDESFILPPVTTVR